MDHCNILALVKIPAGHGGIPSADLLQAVAQYDPGF
jgi:hypothetical protein